MEKAAIKTYIFLYTLMGGVSRLQYMAMSLELPVELYERVVALMRERGLCSYSSAIRVIMYEYLRSINFVHNVPRRCFYRGCRGGGFSYDMYFVGGSVERSISMCLELYNKLREYANTMGYASLESALVSIVASYFGMGINDATTKAINLIINELIKNVHGYVISKNHNEMILKISTKQIRKILRDRYGKDIRHFGPVFRKKFEAALRKHGMRLAGMRKTNKATTYYIAASAVLLG